MSAYVVWIYDQFNQLVKKEETGSSAGAQAIAADWRSRGFRVNVTLGEHGSTTY